MPIPLDVLLSIGVFASEADGKYGVTCMCVVLYASLFPSGIAIYSNTRSALLPFLSIIGKRTEPESNCRHDC